MFHRNKLLARAGAHSTRERSKRNLALPKIRVVDQRRRPSFPLSLNSPPAPTKAAAQLRRWTNALAPPWRLRRSPTASVQHNPSLNNLPSTALSLHPSTAHAAPSCQLASPTLATLPPPRLSHPVAPPPAPSHLQHTSPQPPPPAHWSPAQPTTSPPSPSTPPPPPRRANRPANSSTRTTPSPLSSLPPTHPAPAPRVSAPASPPPQLPAAVL